ncbi:MAG: hypothetical protein ACYDHN_10350 [Solirubrobacteraceae bacterium]
MTAPAGRSRLSHLETWLWTGPIGHLIGGALDFLQALARYTRARARGRSVR